MSGGPAVGVAVARPADGAPAPGASTVLTLHHPALARSYYEQGHWRTDTLYSLLAAHADSRPHDPALRDSTRRLTWRQLREWVDGASGAFVDSGLRPGQRVSLLVSDRAEGVVALLACARQRLVANPSLHRSYTVGEVVSLLDRIRASGLIAETGWSADRDAADAIDAARGLSHLRCTWRLPQQRAAPSEFPPPGPARTPPDQDPDKVCYLAFTSGTTGTPKGVMHSDNTLLANARDLTADWNLDSSDVVLTLSPLSHHIFWVALAQALVVGAELVLNDRPHGASLVDWITATGATYVLGVPTHAMDVLAEQRARSLTRLGSVRTFYMAGAAIPPAVAEAFLHQGITPQNVYGMTENSSHNYTRPGDGPATICTTIGRPGASYEIRIFDPHDRDTEVPPGQIGEIAGRGACLMLGYFDNQQATEQSFNADGWFLSGDLGRLDEQGNLVFTGRAKELIIRGGHNIYPRRIEDMALTHPGIARAAAIPVADERLGEKVCLVLEPAAHAPTAADVLAHLHRCGLSTYDMPEYYLLVDALPLTASGKVLKRDLTRRVADGELTPTPCRFDPATARAVPEAEVETP